MVAKKKDWYFVSSGKTKNPFLLDYESEYLKRIHFVSIQIIETKSSPEKDKESQILIDKVQDISHKNRKTPYSILLTEFGTEYDSHSFAKKIENLFHDKSLHHSLFFIIAGPLGPSEELKKFSKEKLSLSKMTFPHELTRSILFEQIYRAQTITSGHPYHH